MTESRQQGAGLEDGNRGSITGKEEGCGLILRFHVEGVEMMTLIFMFAAMLWASVSMVLP